ncbi:MAG: adenylosuccinate lyase [Candidatus Promineifilaceae bacterium]
MMSAAHIIDSEIYQDAWSTAETRTIFDTRTRFQRWLDIEATLARVQARQGIIPQAAAEEIGRRARLELIDMSELKAEYKRTRHSLVPLLRALSHLCEDGHGEYVHYGPTTQDIEDTGAVLELKEAYQVLLRDLREVEQVLLDLAKTHRHTLVCGRTHGQQGLPITFGFKVAGWASELRRQIERFKEMKPRLFVGLLHGGVGTMAGLGPHASETAALVMAELGLAMPDISWGNARDRFAEYVCQVAMTAATLGRIANEIFVLCRTEVGELAEPRPKGYVGSSTMPHKRNPELSEFAVMLSRLIRGHASMALEAMVCEHERDTRSWRTDWLTLPECSMMLAAMLQIMKQLLGGLVVNEQRMADNLEMTQGLLFSEGLMFYLGEKLGKETAHDILRVAAFQAIDQQRPLVDVLLAVPQVAGLVSRDELNSQLDYRSHLGSAQAQIDRVHETARSKRPTDLPFISFEAPK